MQAEGVVGNGKPLQLFAMFRRVRQLVRAEQYDVVSTDQYYYGLIGYLMLTCYGVGWEVQVHGFEKLHWLRRQLARFVLRRAPSIRVNSERIRQRLATEFGVSGDNVHVVPIHVDTTAFVEPPESFTAIRDQFQCTDGYFHVLTVSRLVPIKQTELLVQACAQLREAGHAVQLHIVGTGPRAEYLQRLIAEQSVTDAVFLHGHVEGDALVGLYHAADCFVLASANEGWGMVVIEALAAGLPVVMSDVGCAGEVVIDEVSGLVLPTVDPDTLAAAIARLIDDADLRSQLIAGGQAALAALPTATEISAKYDAAWQFAANRKC